MFSEYNKSVLLSVLLIFALLFASMPAGLVFAEQQTKAEYSPEAYRLVVQLAEGADPLALAAQSGAELLRTGPFNYCVLQFKDSTDKSIKDKSAIRQQVLALPGVLNAEWSLTYQVEDLSQGEAAIGDPEFSEQWGLHRIRAPQAWAEGATGKGVIIAVVDTGVDLDHPDLMDDSSQQYNLVQGYNAFTQSAELGAEQDDHGHGTAVAGVIAALANDLGIVGVAPEAMIMPIKAMDENGQGEDSIIADGIVWAVDHGARIINLSIGAESQTQVLDDAILYARSRGCLLVAASGNAANSKMLIYQMDNSSKSTQFIVGDGVAYPGAHPEVLAISAVDENDRIADFALTGPEIALSAPGSKILTSYWSKDQTGVFYTSGTSIAAPFVSAAAALLWSKYPDASAEEIKQALLQAASDQGLEGKDNSYGYGRLDVYRALKALAEPSAYVSPAYLGWEGGKVYTDDAAVASEAAAAIRIPAGTFAVQVGPSGQDRKINVSLETVNSAAPLPAQLEAAGKAYLLRWGEAVPEKPLQLSLKVENTLINGTENESENLANSSDRLAYIYKWTGSRWLRVGGGVDPSAGRVTATIYEPGIYCAALSSEPLSSRLSGADRITTALAIAAEAYPDGAESVVLARADDFPDALAGAPLAYKLQAPILLTYPDKLPDDVFQAVQNLAPKRIYILGGNSAVSSQVEYRLSTLAPVSRIAGSDRYATAAAVASSLDIKGEAIIVNGSNFPDAISVAAQAASAGKPILLVGREHIPEATQKVLDKYSVTTTLAIGGPGVLTDELLAKLPEAQRIGGTDRFATSAEVLVLAEAEGDVLYIATGLNFPDALTGGVLAAVNSTNILLVSPAGLTPEQKEILLNLKYSKIVVLGGEQAVPASLVEELRTINGPAH